MVWGHVGVVEAEDKILVIWIVWDLLAGDLPELLVSPTFSEPAAPTRWTMTRPHHLAEIGHLPSELLAR